MELEEIKRRLENWARGKKEGPVRMELHPTDMCNLKCTFCWKRKEKNPTRKELSETQLLRIVREAAKLGVREWIVSGGGEPLMRKKVTLRVLREIKKYRMWGLLTTNGTLLDEKDAIKLVKMGWDQVQFSIDGPNERINDFLRPPHSFKRAVKAVKTLRKVRKKLRSEKPYIGLNTVLSKMNFNRMDEMIKLADEIGAELVFFEPIYPGYSDIDLSIPKKASRELIRSVKKCEKLAKALGIDTNAREFLEVRLVDKSDLRRKILKEVKKVNGFVGAPCFRPWYLMGIKASGFSGCCSTFERGEFIQGKSLSEVWFGRVFTQLRNEMLNKQIPSYCSKCSIVVFNENRMLRRMIQDG